MSISKVLGHTCLNESAWVKSNLLGNHAWVEYIPYFDLAVLEEGNQIWWSNLDLEYFAAPCNLSEFEVVDAIEIHVEGMIISSHNKRLQELVKDWAGIGLVILPFELVSYELLTSCYIIMSPNVIRGCLVSTSLRIILSITELQWGFVDYLIIVSLALFLGDRLSSLSLSPPSEERWRLLVVPQLQPCHWLCSLSTILPRLLLHVVNLDVLRWISILYQKDILIDWDTTIKNWKCYR